MSENSTHSRILDAAEELFAEKGFSETSLRTITSKANVNLAAVNYHFGSKKELIQAVFARFLDPFCQRLDRALEELEEQEKDSITIQRVLEVLAGTIAAGTDDPENAHKLSIFMRLLGLAYTQSQGHMRRFIRENYQDTYQKFLSCAQRAQPDITSKELFWKVHFSIGAAAFAMSSFDSLQAMYERDSNETTSVSEVMQMLVPFVSAGTAAKF